MSVTLGPPSDALIATSGDGTIIRAWRDSADLGKIHAQAVSSEGQVLRSGVILTQTGGSKLSLDVAESGKWALSWIQDVAKAKSTPAMSHARTALFDSPTDPTARITDAHSIVTGQGSSLREVSVAVNVDGALGVAVVKSTSTRTSSTMAAYYQGIDAGGVKVGGFSTLSGSHPSVDQVDLDMNKHGQSVVAWRQTQPGASAYVRDVYARLVGSTTPAFQVHDSMEGHQELPDVEISDVGTSVILWTQPSHLPSGAATTCMRVYDAAGQGGAQTDLGGTTHRAIWGAADMAPDGTFAVTSSRVQNTDYEDANGIPMRSTSTSLEVRGFDASGGQTSQITLREAGSVRNMTTGETVYTGGGFTRLNLSYISGNGYFVSHLFDPTPGGVAGDESLIGDYLTVT